MTGPAARARASAMRAFDSLSSPGYRLFLLALFFAFASIQMQNVAPAWLVYKLTGSAVALGAITSLWSGSLFVFSPLGGAVADRVDRKRLVMLTYAGTGLVSLVIAILVVTGRIQVWHLAVASTVNGALFACNLPGRLALIRDLVGERGVMNAMALNSAVFNVAGITFPMLAGLLVDVLDIGAVFVLIAAIYGLVVTTLAFMPRPAAVPSDAPVGSLVQDVMQGVAFVRRDRRIMGLFLFGSCGVLLGFPYSTLLPAYASGVLHAPAFGLGVLMAAAALGAFFGNMLVAGQQSEARLGRPMVYLGLGFGLALVLLALARTLPVAVLALLAVGLVGMPFLTINQALVQKLAPAHVQGRVMSLYMLTWGIMPLGVMPVSALADAAGVPWALAATGGTLAGAIVVLAAMRFGVSRV